MSPNPSIRLLWSIEPDTDPDPSYLTDSTRYAGVPEEERLQYEAQVAARVAAYNRGEWGFVGVAIEARFTLPTESGGTLESRMALGSLWGIESDAEEEYFRSVAADLAEEARAHLKGLCVPAAIVDAAPLERKRT